MSDAILCDICRKNYIDGDRECNPEYFALRLQLKVKIPEKIEQTSQYPVHSNDHMIDCCSKRCLNRAFKLGIKWLIQNLKKNEDGEMLDSDKAEIEADRFDNLV